MNGVCHIVGDCSPSDVYYNGDAVSVSHVQYHAYCEAPFSDAYMALFDEARGCLVLEFHAPGTARVGSGITATAMSTSGHTRASTASFCCGFYKFCMFLEYAN
jgi:hypothetical protein